jgi:TolB-like protein/tetratricopeptide (TPR) repeat protein
MGLVSELRRRNVFRMAVLYVVAAWLIMQVAEVLSALLPGLVPEWLGQVTVAVLAVGFPIALVLSWFYEITAEGVSLEKDVEPGKSITHITGRRLDFIVISLLSAAVILFAVHTWWIPEPPELSIAVLPFENMSADPEQEYFSDGMSEEILNLLAQIEPLKVIARTSSFSFKGQAVDAATMAEQMNVRHLLEGSVRRSGDRVRITAQLIDARDSSHLWSETYDRDYSAENLFTIQSEVARAITGKLRMTLTGEDEERLAKVPTENTEAYTAYLLGRERLRDRKVAELADAVEQFALAIDLDPQFAGAYSGLADACYLYEGASGGQSHEHCPSSLAGREQLARKALELNPESGEAWTSLGQIYTSQATSALYSRSPDLPKIREQFREAFAAYERGLELNPTQPQGYQWYGQALINVYAHPDPPSGWIKAWQAGVWQPIFDKGLEVDPLSISLHYNKAQYPIWTRSKEEAMWHAQRMVEIAPGSPQGYETVGEHEWLLNGRIDESIRWMTKSIEIDPQNPWYPGFIGLAYAALGDPDMALAYFDLVNAALAPDNASDQHRLLVAQTTTRLVAGRIDAHQVAEQLPLPTEFKGFGFVGLKLAVFVDLATGRPANALARIETALPKCLGATEIPDEYLCPNELVRVYRELGDHSAAEALSAANLRRAQLWVDGFPADWWFRYYAGALATEGRTDEALDVLENLVASGWRGGFGHNHRFHLCCAVDFDAIRDHPRFQAIVATIEADVAQQLENVRDMQRRGEVPTLEEVKALTASAQKSN